MRAGPGRPADCWEAGLRPGTAALEQADALMERFAVQTGLERGRPPRRYLWTDAFAVCNELALWRATGIERHRQRAWALIDQVHHVLGRHRADDARRGWISGLADREAELHPTRGGLRIGKPLPERPPGATLDERLEWERDGQYFHYLTRWMHALDQTARWTGEARFNAWARELAGVAQRAFTRAGPGGPGMAWKLSIDLSRPLVSSMGQHDPLDGLVSCLQLRATAARLPAASRDPTLDDAVSAFAGMLPGHALETADPLGIGGLLVDAGRVAQMLEQGALAVRTGRALLETLLSAALPGLAAYARSGDLDQSIARRLAFRELGLAIGLAVLAPMREALASEGDADVPGARRRVASLAHHAALRARILDSWGEPTQRAEPAWLAHEDINEVMLATALAPAGVLLLPRSRFA